MNEAARQQAITAVAIGLLIVTVLGGVTTGLVGGIVLVIVAYFMIPAYRSLSTVVILVTILAGALVYLLLR